MPRVAARVASNRPHDTQTGEVHGEQQKRGGGPTDIGVWESALHPAVEVALVREETEAYPRFGDVGELSMAELAALKLAMDRLDASYSMVSGVSKQGHETTMAIVKNMLA